ncbi:serine/threonine-protein phosphatase 4 regulatory subunit 2-like [Dysidea avara]|uniref:serine/threonine-protein phosphatase 4 regulatory subunit 2-like n=1 Tax=Dysidea avara TaxID=196820 RepID=UPI0033261BAD
MDYRKMEQLLEKFDDQQSSYLQLEPVLLDVSHTGIVRFPWKLIRPLLRYKLKSVLGEAFGTSKNIPDDDKDLSRQILERFDKFSGPPFTVQRLCELLAEPKRWYKRRSPFLHGLEKILLVVSTVEPDLSWMSEQQPVISDEGKERLLPQEELTCVEDMIVADGESNATTTTGGLKRPLVELSEADSTVSNGFEDSGAMHQQDNLSSPPAKKRCTDSDEESNSTSDASSTTSAHETLPED